MATFASPSPPSSPSFHQRRKSWLRKVERCCCVGLSYFPLAFVHGLTTWAVCVQVSVSMLDGLGVRAYSKAALGILLYVLLNASYSVAVFTNPGSTLDQRVKASSGYGVLPTYEDVEEGENDRGVPHAMSLVTAKSTGEPRFCKKCQSVKPDRAHHCSSCGRCVLKMDHHCPWLATCVGLRNYKAFLLFLAYTSLFCWLAFFVSANWVWTAIMSNQHVDEEGTRVVHTVLLAVLGGIIGLVLSGFTAWHLYLATTGQTTIESLEKTRYLSPLRKSMEPSQPSDAQGDSQQQSLLGSLKETHANALPGILRPEEGESRSHSASPTPPSALRSPHSGPQPQHSSSPAHASLRQSYASLEAQREFDRHAAYLDEQDSEKLPNAFDNGWKRNLRHVFGEDARFWALPVCNTTGDGWMWDLSPQWTDARARIASHREREASMWQGGHLAPPPPPPRQDLRWTPGRGFIDRASFPSGPGSPTRRSRPGDIHGAIDRSQMQLQPLDRRKMSLAELDEHEYDTSSDEEPSTRPRTTVTRHGHAATSTNWNDIPEEFLSHSRKGVSRSASRGRAKGD